MSGNQFVENHLWISNIHEVLKNDHLRPFYFELNISHVVPRAEFGIYSD